MDLLAIIQAASMAAELTGSLIEKFTSDDAGQPLPPEAEVVPGVTATAIRDAAAKGRAAAAELRSASLSVLNRLNMERDAGRPPV